MKFTPLKNKPLPKAPKLTKVLGPSFIILGLGLGSGEVILWPYLASNYGMGVIWGALLGLTFQFFMNMEIERYALAHGESIFVGMARKWKKTPVWYLFSTFFPWIWPGIAASSATLIVHLLGFSTSSIKWVAIGLLITMGLVLSFGPVLYKTVERFQKVLIMFGVPSIFIISILLTSRSDWSAAAQGIIGKGDGFWLLPAGVPIATFLAALAYSGAGGNLNLAQSFYVKEKGFGMGKYATGITSLITGQKKSASLTGYKFEPNAQNVKEFNRWWKTINREHFIVFWLTGSITIVLLSLLAFTTTHGAVGTKGDISFVIKESVAIGEQLLPFFGTFFLMVVSLTLYGTQLTVYDATSRILAENTILASGGRLKEKHIGKAYYIVLWLMILSGVGVFLSGFTQPLQLLVVAAVLNAFAMFVHTGLTLRLTRTSLAKAIRPNLFRVSAMRLAFVFYGGFSIYVIITELKKLI